MEGLRIPDNEGRWANEELLFSVVILALSILLPLLVGGTATDIGIRIILWLPLLPVQAILIDRIIFLYDKQSALFLIDRQKAAVIISNVLEREGFNIKIVDNKKRYPRVAKYNTLLIINEGTIDIRLYLKEKGRVPQLKDDVREVHSIVVYIGPITVSKMNFIEQIKYIICRDLL